jgi:circadian clock protein KaiB
MRRRAQPRFRLYVADHTQNSVRAIANLAALCREHLPQGHEIEIVDVLKEPDRALVDGIHMTPTLVRLSPAPLLRIVGTLSDTAAVLRTLGLEAEAA